MFVFRLTWIMILLFKICWSAFKTWTLAFARVRVTLVGVDKGSACFVIIWQIFVPWDKVSIISCAVFHNNIVQPRNRLKISEKYVFMLIAFIVFIMAQCIFRKFAILLLLFIIITYCQIRSIDYTCTYMNAKNPYGLKMVIIEEIFLKAEINGRKNDNNKVLIIRTVIIYTWL